MKITSPILALAAVALAAPQASADVKIGDSPNYTFREAPVNSMGVKSLKDLRGKPVLVEFWGTR
jgi:hypothetical protein